MARPLIHDEADRRWWNSLAPIQQQRIDYMLAVHHAAILAEVMGLPEQDAREHEAHDAPMSAAQTR